MSISRLGLVVAGVVTSAVGFGEAGDTYITDKGNGVYEVDATSGIGLADFSDAWTNAFLKSTDTFVFKGSGEQGMSLDYGPWNYENPTTNQFSHIVFDGGSHVYGWSPTGKVNAATVRLASGSTRENPALKVTRGTFLRYYLRHYNGGSQYSGGKVTTGVDDGAWIEIEPDATLQVTNDVPFALYSTTTYLDSPILLHPGATFEISKPKEDATPNKANARTMFAPNTVFYVPETTPGDDRVARVKVAAQDWVYLGSAASPNPGFGLDVGANATLEFTGQICGDEDFKSFAICKYGDGLLRWKGIPESGKRDFTLNVNGGTMVYDPGVRYGSIVRAFPNISPGATLELPSTNGNIASAVTNLYNEGTVRVTGTGTILFRDSRKVGTVETPDGAEVCYWRTIDPRDGRAPVVGEDPSRLTLADTAGNTYPVLRADADYVYWDYVEELAEDAELVGVHSLKVVNPTPETPRTVTATAADYAIGNGHVTIEIAANTTLALEAPISGTVNRLSGAGDLVLQVLGNLKILSADDFTGNLTVKGGQIVLPASLEGRVTAEAGAQVLYLSEEDLTETACSVTMTVTGYTGETTLENYPVLVRLSEATLPGYAQLAATTYASGARSSTGAVCPIDVECWNPRGESLVWVRVPEVKKAGTTFRLLFGKGLPSKAASETWRRTGHAPGTPGGSGNFAGVWHMAADSKEDVPDATGHGLTAVPCKDSGFEPSVDRDESIAVTGAIGTGRQIAAKSTANGGRRLRVAAENFAPMKIATNFTVSTWVKFYPKNSYQRFFSHGNRSSGAGSGWEVHAGASASWVQRYADSTVKNTWTDAWNDRVNTWAHYVFVYDGRKARAYVNGQPMGGEMSIAAGKEACLVPDMALCIGGAEQDWNLIGALDESRLFDGALSADWVTADYASQKSDAAFLTAGPIVRKATLAAALDKVVAGTAQVVATLEGPDGSTHTVTATLLDAEGTVLATRQQEVTLPTAALKFTFEELTPGTACRVLVSATETLATDVYVFDFAPAACYKAQRGDYGISSLQFAEGEGLNADNWQNVQDPSDILHKLDATCAYDFIVDATKGPDPVNGGTGGSWQMRTYWQGDGTYADYTFPGKSLTIIGDRKSDLTYANGGGLGLKNYYSPSRRSGVVTIPELILKNGSIWCEAGQYQHWLDSNIVIPENYSGFFEIARNNAYERFLYLYGTLTGEGTAVFCGYSRNRGSLRGFYFHNDLSGFTGKMHFDLCHNVRFCADYVPQPDSDELVTDAITLDNRCNFIVSSYRADDCGSGRLVFEDDTTWATPNRGITLADSVLAGVTGNYANKKNWWDIAIADGKTVTVACPFFSAAADKGAKLTRLAMSGDLEGFTRGTLKLCGAEGDWAGTFVATNGTLVLAGAKPLAEGTLDASATARVELDVGSLNGTACYLKEVSPETLIQVALPTGFSLKTGVTLLTTPSESNLRRDNIVLPPGSSRLVVRAKIEDDRRTYVLHEKRSLVVVIR